MTAIFYSLPFIWLAFVMVGVGNPQSIMFPHWLFLVIILFAVAPLMAAVGCLLKSRR